jgi:UDP-N-acetylglucosamine:LPS N-acetylglucosamine transferase
MLENEAARAGELIPLVLALLGDRPRLTAMAAAMGKMSQPDAARTIASALLELAA